jgi:hypothetical protein
MLISTALSAQVRTDFLLEKNWKFSRADNPEAIKPDFNDATWQTVTVPHDWAIYGPFDGNADVQNVAIEQDGETKASMKAGRSGGLPFIGVGWYRVKFNAPDFDKSKTASILFDGAMSNASVYLNGHEVGYWPYGYNSFYFDITQYLKEKDNLLAVRLENYPESTRWYPGAGIYRNVHLIVTNDVHVPVWGVQLTTPTVKPEYAKVNLKTKVDYPAGKTVENLSLITEIKSGGQVVSRSETAKLTQYDDNTFEQTIVVNSPQLWSPETPALYTAETKLYDNGVLKDVFITRFGIRKVEIIPDKGLFLNGKETKFRGVCNHHDLGPLGAAINKSALRRQLAILKDMGCNAIRTSHNMPAPELVELCDEMGFMVMIEAFDEWKRPKCKNGYNIYFDEWAEKDIVNMVWHYRNNPSAVMWSIGNEVPDQQTTPVFVYTNYPSAELFINGKSQGRISKDTAQTAADTDNDEAANQLLRQRRYRLMCMDVKYEPGTVKVVAYDAKGNAVAEKEVHTAGKPHHLELVADRTILDADGKDLSFITVKVVDKDGNLCPDASNTIHFKTSGAGNYRAAANGDATNIEQFHLPEMSVFKGQLIAIVQSSEQAGKIRFEAQAKGLKKAEMEIKSR